MSSVNHLLGRLLRQGGSRLINTVIDKTLPDAPASGEGKRNILSGLVGLVAMRAATRSVPGATVVTSGLVAKERYDRRKALKAAERPTGQKDPPKA